MKVCIAEKPSVAREIAFVIGAKSRKNGYFEGNGYAVTWTFGHLCTLQTPDDYRQEWKKWSLQTLPIQPDKFQIKLLKNKGVKKQFATIKKLLRQTQLVINCGDAGQEGELIQRWVLQQAKYKGKVQRLWISSLTPEAIKDGFLHLRDASHYDNLYHAGFSRAIGDWLLGMNATRLYTLKYGGYKQVLSIGRVQTPTLAMLVQRHLEIINFKPVDYWELHTTYREVEFKCEAGGFLKKEIGEQWLAQVKNKPFEVLDFAKKNGKEAPPRLFDLTSLQVYCNKRFNFSAENTLQLVQSLYEKKVVTYPRVDTTYLPDDLYPKIAGILKKMTHYNQFTQSLLGKKIKKSGKVFNNKKVTDHHAIIPTGLEKNLPITEQKVYDAIARHFIAAFYPDCKTATTTVVGGVRKEEDFSKKIPPSVSKDANKEPDTTSKDPYPEYITFRTSGKEILSPGWRVLFPQKNKNNFSSDPKNDKILPPFKKGESGQHTPQLLAKQTRPPKYYTEATLLRAMETAGKQVDDDELRELMKANGIGRPSTRANIIETLFRRRYAKRQKKQIVPTQTGVRLIEIIKNDLLKSAELTGQWEKQLRDIEEGTYTAQKFVAGMRTMVNQLVQEVSAETVTQRLQATTTQNTKKGQRLAKPRKRRKTSRKAALTEQTCPKCRQGKLLKGKAAYGCSRWQEGCDFRLPFVFAGKKIPELQLKRLLEYGATIQLRGFVENGQKITGNVKFDDQFQLQLIPKSARKSARKSTQKKALNQSATKPPSTAPQQPNNRCPKCRQGTILKGKTAYGCSRWQEGCDFRFSFEKIRLQAGNRTLNKELVWEIISGAEG